MSDTLYTVVSAITGFEQLEDTPIHVNTNAVLVSGHLGTSSNATINGNISVTGTVDGRDIATDGTNLDNTKTTLDTYSADWNHVATNSAISVAFDVTNSGSGAYRFNNGGFTNDDNPSVHLQRGHTYRFRVNASGHPFYIKTTAGTGTGNQYLSGVSGNGTQTGNVDFEVPHNAPRKLFYQCSAHSSMVGPLYINDAADSTTLNGNSANWKTAYTHSQGSVTDHSDVSNAGSGQIITATERTDFSNTKTTLNTYSADWNYTATNSADHANEFSFKTITLSGNRTGAATGADIVADTTTDTLTLCAGPNIELISDPTNDVITISGTAGGGGASGEDNEFSFKTITLSANRAGAAIGADVVADTTTDTLTLCAGPNIQLLSEVGSDVITISGGTSIITDNSTTTTTHNAYYSGAGPTVAYQQTLTGNGTTKIFEVSATISDDFLALVVIEGVMQIPTTHYSISASHVHALSTVKDLAFNTAPGNGERIDVRVFKDANTTEQVSTTTENYSGNGASATYQQVLTGDGSTKIFEVSAKIIDPILAVVNINGIMQEPTTHYTVSAAHVHSSNTNVRDLVFTEAPGNGERIGVRVFQDAVADIDQTTTINNTVYSGATVTSTSNLTGDGSTHVFEVSARLSEAAMAIVSVGGIVQIPTTHYTVSAAAAHLSNADVADINFSIAPLSGELIEIRGLHDGTVLNETTINNTYTTVNNNSAVWQLRVQEIDGSPNTVPITAVKVPNGTLSTSNKTATLDYINQGALSELISTSANWNNTKTTVNTYSADWTWVAENSAGGLTVKEVDGSKSVNDVTTIVVTNGTLTDNSNGQVTIDTGGGGGGGSTSPFTSASGKFYSTNGGDYVGLGTSVPIYKLDITDTSAAFIHLSGKGNSAEAGIHMYTDARGGYTIYMENNAEGDDDTLIFNCGSRTANATVMMLSGIPNSANTGLLDINHIYARTKIGIGTDNPADPLTVIGNISSTGQVSTHTVAGVGTGDLTLDSGGDIILDADGADVILKDGGTEFGRFKRDSSDFVIKSATNNKDIIFKGQDGGSTITAMTIDMSEGGKVGIGTVTPGEALSVVGNISASGDITAANNSFKFADGQKLTSGNVTDLKGASGVQVTDLGTDNTPTINFNASQMQKVAINGNCTFQDATNVGAGGNVVLEITGDSGSARTLTFPSGWKFIGAKPTTIKASGLSLLQLLVFSGSGQSNVVCTYNTQD